MGRPRKTPKQPPLAIPTMNRLPADVQEQLEEMAARNASIDELKKHILKNGFLISKPRIKAWVKSLPLKRIRHVNDLPEELREKVISWWLSRRDYSSCLKDLKEAGYTADIFTMNRWYGELLRDEAKAEIAGTFDPTRTPISKELEAWALTATLDKVVDAIMRSQYRPEPKSPADFSKMADVLLKVVNSNISRRKLELEEGNVMARARSEFDRKMRDLLAAHPELVEQIAAIADEAEVELVVN